MHSQTVSNKHLKLIPLYIANTPMITQNPLVIEPWHFQENIGTMSKNLRALVTKNSFKERYKTALSYLAKLKGLVDDVSYLDK